MAIEDFKVINNIKVDGVEIDLTAAQGSGGVVYDSTQGKFVTSVGNIPVGVVRMWASGSTSPSVPDDYLICDGRQDLSQTIYATLYAVIGDRFTASPNGSTFGLPSFNSSGFAYPFAVSPPSSGTMTSGTRNIGSGTTATHTHQGNALTFNTNGGMSANSSHSHNLNAGSDPNHTHNFADGTTNSTAHNHNTSNASTGHSHSLAQPGTTAAVTSQATANHDHNGDNAGANHTHTTSNDSHTHNNTDGPTITAGQTQDHNHSLLSTLSSANASHFHTAPTSGFYFIIKFR